MGAYFPDYVVLAAQVAVVYSLSITGTHTYLFYTIPAMKMQWLHS